MAKKDKKDEKKKKKRGVPWLLIILILLLFLIGGVGFGMGWFDSNSENDGTDASSVADTSASDSKEDESSAADKTTVAVKISGDKYVYDGADLTLEDLKSKLQGLDKATTIIEVTDDDAVENAVTSLKEMLDSLSLSYTGIS